MKITLREITVQELVNGYEDKGEGGVTGFSGKLDIRPAYQREFVYKEEQRNAVVRSVRQGFPINVMYWSLNESENRFEILDGQQRTISLGQFVHGVFSIADVSDPDNPKYFSGLNKEERQALLDYKIQVYVCEGTERQKLDWFKTINIAGEKLTPQELRNAVYCGPWLADAKRHFSGSNPPAVKVANGYVLGSALRQELLETAIEWAKAQKESIEDYMARNQLETSANPLWLHFNGVIAWVKASFPHYRKEMKSVDWGSLYSAHHHRSLDPKSMETEISALMRDDEVSKKAGIYAFVLDRNERHLNLRVFTHEMKRVAYEKQSGICPMCPAESNYHAFDIMEGDHIDPWHSGGKTNAENCQMLCRPCNRRKSGK